MTVRFGLGNGIKVKTLLLAGTVLALVWFAACGGGSSGESTPPPAPTTYTIGGTVSGLTGSGLVLQDNGGNNLTVTANGSFTFTTAITSGDAYAVTVLTQPSSPAQTCTVSSGTGTATANVTSVQAACAAPTFTIGGTVSGLLGTGLVLQDNGGNNFSVTANGSFTFSTALASGTAYKVTVLTQPSSPAQTCSVTNGSGTATANVTNVQVACASGFTIGGTVSGLTGTGLVLQDNGGNNLSITANGSFIFSTALTSGTAYAVTVLTQPSSPAQTCNVTDGSGTATANVTSVQVACGSLAPNEWTWVSGADVVQQKGTYGTEGTAAPDNAPGSRWGAMGWTDTNRNFWLFGGTTNVAPAGDFNDLWKYSAGEWTWVSGSNTVDQSGTYGTEGTAGPNNVPGARDHAVTWTDGAGNFWLFGGAGYDSAGTDKDLNDLWKYSAGEWTWVSGADVVDQQGTYGTKGTASPSNVPGWRFSAVGWTDAAGNLWLFGGNGQDPTGTLGRLNDLWEYSVSAGEWTWVSGADLANQAGTYGTKGTPAAGNVPGGRSDPLAWTDAAGNFWLFGGVGYDSTGTLTDLNDLWKFSAGEWTWMSGSNVGNQSGTYGTQGTAAASNAPGGRGQAVGWTDAGGNLWLFGGYGCDSTPCVGQLYLNDLWEYGAGEWTWMGGANIANQKGTYGTQGTAAATNVPGARWGAVSWIDAAGNLWLFGGFAIDSAGNSNIINDLWKYGPP
jgi:N-acetylneuraminic acid mutarotase